MTKLLLISLISVGALFSQTTSPPQVKADYDFAQFRANESQTILEIYYAITRETLSHVSSDEGYTGSYKINLDISGKDLEITSLDWEGSDITRSLEDITAGQTITDVKTLLFRPGEYSLLLTITDLNNSSEYEYQKDLLVRDFTDENIYFSDIEISHSIVEAESANRFVKNGYQITPNPSLIYTTNRPIIYYYLELYNLDKLGIDSSIVLQSYISDQNGEIVKNLPAKKVSTANESAVIVNNAYIGALFTGIYIFNTAFIIPESSDTLRQSKPFYMYRPADKVAVSQYNSRESNKPNPFAFMSEDELDREFEYLKYVLDDDAKDRYEELNLTGKREYLYIFWTEQEEANPGFRTKLFDRIDFANARYTVGKKDGWRSNPGRILIMYGIPDDIEKQRSVSTTKSVEIWSYQQVEGGALFVFVDVTGYGELRLVHSTVMDEIKDYQWQQRYLQ